jgi:putative redox protein
MKTSNIKYLGELRTSATHLRSNESIVTDAPIDNNGKGEAFSPTDLAATALGSCAITVMSIAAQNAGHEFKNSQVQITKIMTGEAPRKIKKIIIEFDLTCEPALDAEAKKRYERVAQTCPVSLSLHPDLEQEMVFNWLN